MYALCAFFNQLIHLLEGFIQARWIFSSGLGEIGSPTSTSTNQRGDLFDNLSGMILLHQILTHCGEERHFRPVRCPKDDNCRLVFITQRIRHLSEGFLIYALDPTGDDIDPIGLTDLGGKRVALRAGELTLKLVELFFKLVLPAQQFFQALERVLLRPLQNAAHVLEHVLALTHPVEGTHPYRSPA